VPATLLWIALLVTAGTASPTRSVAAGGASLPLDDAWFVSLAYAESLVLVATARGEVDSTARTAVTGQIRLGVHVLGAILHAGVVADTLLAEPLATGASWEPPARGWAYRVFKATGVISALAGIVHLAASLAGASPQTRSVLGYVGGSAAGVSGLLNRWMARPPPRPEAATLERAHTLDLETDLSTSVHQTEFEVELLWRELRSIALDSCATDDQAVRLARRYTSGLHRTTGILDSRIAASLAIAGSCVQHPGLAPESRERCAALASHLDAVRGEWQKRQWLFERSKRNTLDYLVVADRP
jgi:hypothetical protein